MPQKTSSSHSQLKRLMFWSGPFLIVTLLTAYGVRYWRASSALEAEIQRIRDRGEPMRLEELLPAIDPDEDAGPLLREALALYQTPDEQFFVLLNAAPPTPPGDYRAFREALATNQKSLALVAQAVEKPRCRLVIEDKDSLYQLSRMSELLHARCLQSIGAGDQEQAQQAVLQSLLLSKLIWDEPFASSRFVGSSLGIKALNTLQELLGNTHLAERDVVLIDHFLGELGNNSFIKPTVFAQRAIGVRQFEFLMDQGHISYDLKAPLDSGWWEKPVFSHAHYMEIQSRFLRSMTDIAEMIDGEGSDVNQAVIALDHKIQALPYISDLYFYFPKCSGIREEVLRDRQRMIFARFALRVDRFRQQHGKLPKTLAQVCDRQLPQVPPDLRQGKALVYETHEQGFVIHLQSDGTAEDENFKECRFEVIYPDTGDLQDAANLSTQE